jgi:hypothetical protein
MPDISLYGQPSAQQPQTQPQPIPQMGIQPYQPPQQGQGFNAAQLAKSLGATSQNGDQTTNLMNQQQPSTTQQWQQFLANYGSAAPQQPTPQSQMMPWQGGTFGSQGGY